MRFLFFFFIFLLYMFLKDGHTSRAFNFLSAVVASTASDSFLFSAVDDSISAQHRWSFDRVWIWLPGFGMCHLLSISLQGVHVLMFDQTLGGVHGNEASE